MQVQKKLKSLEMFWDKPITFFTFYQTRDEMSFYE